MFMNSKWTACGVRGDICSGTLLGLAAFTKHDGLVFVGTAILVLLMGERSRMRMVAVLVPALIIAAPWYVFAAAIQAPDRDFYAVTVSNLGSFAGRIPGIARLFSLNMLSLAEWGPVWFAVVGWAILGTVKRSISAPLLLVPIVVPLAFYAASLSFSAWPDYMLHVRTSVDRLIVATVPFGLWFILEQFVPDGSKERVAR
jgi:hypothetical protein